MSLFAQSGGGANIAPTDYSSLIMLPLVRDSLALRTSRNVTTAMKSVQLPLLTANASVAVVAEGSEITASDPTISEVTVTPFKIAGLHKFSRELASDSSEDVQAMLGEQVANGLRTKLDTLYFTGAGTGAPDPKGVFGTTGITTSADTFDGTNLDPVSNALMTVEAAGGHPDVIVCSPATYQHMLALKQGTGSNMPVLDPNPALAVVAENGGQGQTNGPLRSLFGTPLYVDTTVGDSYIGVWDSQAVATVMREDVTLIPDTSRYLEFDSYAVLSTIRVSWAVLAGSRVVKVAVSFT